MDKFHSSSACSRLDTPRVSVRLSLFAVMIFVFALALAFAQTGCVSPVGSLSVSQSNLSFGNVVIGSISRQGLTLRNTGTVPFTITEAVASGRGFTITEPSFPLTLAAGQSATLIATFAPSAMGEAAGNLSLIEKIQESAPQLSGASGSVAPSVTSAQRTISLAGVGVPVTPSITTQPTSDTVEVGQTATFSVTSSGGAPLNYQWSKNGSAISGATSSTYTTPVATLADSGSQFTVKVNNSTGAVTSNAAILTVKAAGQLTASTASLNYGNITLGSSSALPVTLTNTGGTNVSISNVTLSGAGLTIGGVSSGLILAAGNSVVLSVMFAPPSAGTLNGSVTIASDASDPTVKISLSGVAVQPVSHSVTLGLAPSSSTVVGYNVYRSSAANGPYVKLNSPLVVSTTYTDSSVVANQTYFYVGTSVDSAGNETAYSNQVSATIP